MRITLVVFLVTVVSSSYSWNIPNLPSGKRTQFYVLHNDGGYKYGYDTGKDYFAKQAGDAKNEVSGHYVYKDITGRDVDVKYTAGVHGFVPEGLDKLRPQPGGPQVPVQSYAYAYQNPSAYAAGYSSSQDDQANTGDASYSFTIDTDSYKRQESSDASGNIQGQYSYTNEAGQHDLRYIAGSNTGFVATSGSLSSPNGLEGKSTGFATGSSGYSGAGGRYAPSSVDSSASQDGSYSFGYSTGDQSRQESSDAHGNVQGKYVYTNSAGTHDLSYVAGSATGFLPTGGSLSQPNGLIGKTTASQYSGYQYPISQTSYGTAQSSSYTPTVPNADGSYSFSFTTNDQSRQESSDASGNVQGKYSYTNEAGTHDLSYVAGSTTGFQATGGSLSQPNGLEGKPVTQVTQYASQIGSSNHTDGSYSFSFATNDQSRQESSDASGNVQGKYSYTNPAGTHDLSYVAGAQTGFITTGGSLAVPNGLEGRTGISTTSTFDSEDSSSSTDDLSDTGDASYSFTVDTDEYKREETSDAQGNVKGSFVYKNSAGQHDLSFVAGSETGFVPTGGSLATPNGLEGKTISAVTSFSTSSQISQDDQANTGDASYSFTIDTPEYQRQESSDPQGNVKGSYSYNNIAGSHDLSYQAGSSTGFVATGGSLSVPNGVAGLARGPNFKYLPPQAKSSVIFSGAQPTTSFENQIGNVLVKTYLPPESSSKYGYVYEST